MVFLILLLWLLFPLGTHGDPFRLYMDGWVPLRLPPSVRGTHEFSIENSAIYRNGRRLKNKKKDLPTNKHRRSNRCYLAVIVVDRPKFKLWDGQKVYRYFYCLNILKPEECLMPHFIHFNIIQIPLISLTFGFPILASINRSS